MREQYDFSNSVQNPYWQKPRKTVTILMDEATISYFKDQEQATGIPYQHLMNLYLSDCANNQRFPSITGGQRSG